MQFTRRPSVPVVIAAAAAVLIWSACFEGESFSLGGDAQPDEGLGQPWEQDNAYSPTGTMLVPSDDGLGYAIIDEACGGDRLSADYADRFRTPMFRDIAFDADLDVAWLVDGSLLWTLDTAGDEPVRTGLDELPGHPVALHAAGGRLWVALIDAGLRGYAVGADGVVDVSDVVVALDAVAGRQVLDVDGTGDVLFAALGTEGVAAIRLDEAGLPTETLISPAAGPFVNAVRADATHVAAAACERAQVFTWSLGATERGERGTLQMQLLADITLPFGAAKGVELVGDVLYVSAGEALLAFRLDDTGPTYLGYWFSDEPGFYVNETVSDDAGMLYLAAGDQSVRAIDTTDVPLLEGAPVPEPNADASLDGPQQAESLTGEVHMVPKDPIAIDLSGDRLFVLGNFRYLGERTLEVMDVSIPGFLQPDTGYVQPNVGVAASRLGDQLVVHGSDGVHRVIDVDGERPEVVASFDYEAPLRGTAVSGGELLLVPEQGAVVRAAATGGVTSELRGTHDAWGVASADGRTWVADAADGAILGYDDASGEIIARLTDSSSFLGEAELAAHELRLLAYDRVLGQLITFDLATNPPTLLGRAGLGSCEAYDLADFYSGASHATASFLDTAAPALLCPRTSDGGAAVVWLDLSADAATVAYVVNLPTRIWADAAGAGERLTLVAFDNNTYITDVLTVDATSGEVLADTEFIGHGNAVELVGGRTWVVDGDHGVWPMSPALHSLGAPLGL